MYFFIMNFTNKKKEKYLYLLQYHLPMDSNVRFSIKQNQKFFIEYWYFSYTRTRIVCQKPLLIYMRARTATMYF